MRDHAGSIVVVGLGNPILSDDSAGWHVAERVKVALSSNGYARRGSPVHVVQAGLGGLALAELLVGYDAAVIIDAVLTAEGKPGTVRRTSVAEFTGSLNTASSHDVTLIGGLHLLRQHRAAVPTDDQIEIVAIEVADVWTFSEVCTPAVAAAIPGAADLVLEILAEWNA